MKQKSQTQPQQHQSILKTRQSELASQTPTSRHALAHPVCTEKPHAQEVLGKIGVVVVEIPKRGA